MANNTLLRILPAITNQTEQVLRSIQIYMTSFILILILSSLCFFNAVSLCLASSNLEMEQTN